MANQFTLLHNGEQYFPALLQAIQQAQHEIFLECYWFNEDTTANRIRDALGDAAERGVDVHVVIDWMGSDRKYAPILRDHLHSKGVHCRLFNPWFRRGFARTHRKVSVIDQHIAFVGGINIVDDYYNTSKNDLSLTYPRWDCAVRMQGDIVATIYHHVHLSWGKLTELGLLNAESLPKTFSRLTKTMRKRINYFNISPRHKAGNATYVVRDNLRFRRTIEKSYLKAIDKAQTTIYIANPYFAPSMRLHLALIRAAQRGVQVHLLLGVGEFAWQDMVAKTYYSSLLEAGVHIFEYHKTLLHGKLGLVDDTWATVGSSNFDGLSLFLNQEANIIIEDKAFAQALKQRFNQGIHDAVQIEYDEWKNLSWLSKAKRHLAHWFYRNLFRLLTLGRYK